MKCPKCGQEVNGFTVKDAAAVSEQFRRTVKCVAYCCEACGCILSVESDPLERDAQIEQIKKDASENRKLLEQLMRKIAAWKTGQAS